MKDRIERVILEIEKLIINIRQNKEEFWIEVNQQMPDLIQIMTEFLHFAEEKRALGEEFPVDIIICQIQNLNEAYRRKDAILLADTLQYEIINALYVFMEQGEW